MRRGALLLLGLIGGLFYALPLAGGQDQDHVYTVAQVLAGLAHDPQAWVGRTALVRGAALSLLPGCAPTRWCPAGLYEPRTPRPGPILLLEPGPADPLVESLRRVPLLAGVAPRPQRLHGRATAVYRVRFPAVAQRSCDARPCVTAVLVDAVQM